MCPRASDPLQRDWDRDGRGDRCDRSARVILTGVKRTRGRLLVRARMWPATLPATAFRLTRLEARCKRGTLLATGRLARRRATVLRGRQGRAAAAARPAARYRLPGELRASGYERARSRARRVLVRARRAADHGVPCAGWSPSFSEVGRSIHAALPARGRNPLRALDERAMELASGDQELRAALFRFVDVTPACRSLDDLARHLADYLEEVDDRPAPLEAAMRMSTSRAGRAALGAAAAAGVRHMAHRFIVGETPAAALRPIRRLWEHGAAVSLDLLGEATVTEAEADRYAARCREALDTLAEAAPGVARAPGARARRPRAAPAREPVREGLRADARCSGRRRPRRAARTPPGGCARSCCRARELGAHLHIDMESVDTLEATTELVFDLLDEPELRDGPSAGHRDAGLPARLAASSSSGCSTGAARAGAGLRSWCGS